MADDKSASRGPGGSPSDQGGLVGRQGSAPASSRETLIRHLEFALDAFRDNENEGWFLNIAASEDKRQFPGGLDFHSDGPSG